MKVLKDLFIDELHDILSAEEQIIKALPDVIKACESTELKKAYTSHLKETKGQVQRLNKIFKLLKIAKQKKFCKATKGLIDECKDVLKDYKTKSPTRDAALISKTQRIEHYEISAYGTVHAFAKELGLSDVVSLLQETLNEEGNANKTLNKLAIGGLLSSGINGEANQHYESKEVKKVSKTLTKKKTVAKSKVVKRKTAPKSKTIKR